MVCLHTQTILPPSRLYVKGAGKDIYQANFSDYLPDILKNDPKMKAFSDAVTMQSAFNADVTSARTAEVGRMLFCSRTRTSTTPGSGLVATTSASYPVLLEMIWRRGR